MADKITLSEGALSLIMRGGEFDDPIMQVLGSKRIASGSTEKERFRLLLSDGKYVISFAMLSREINEKSSSGELTTNTIVKIKQYMTSVINNADKGKKRVLVILDLETLVPGEETSKIGNPEQLPEDGMEQDAPVTHGSATNSQNGNNGHLNSTSPNRPVAVASAIRHNSGDLNVSLQDRLTHPISSLSPYQNKWVIKARVSNKSAVRTWSNSRGEGKLFSMDLIDESGEIGATAFREHVDKFYDMIEVDKVYYISKCILKPANKRFTTLKNDYEMTFTNDTIVQECHDVVSSIPQTQYEFISIDKIAQIEPETFIDIIGVCKTASDVETFQARSTGRELKKREITLVDQSNSAIAATLWGNDAEKFDSSTQPVIAIKGAKVREFGGGKNISVMMQSIMKINPDIPESHRLRGWYDNGGNTDNVTDISAKSTLSGFLTPWMSLKETQDQGLGTSERGDYFQTKATILLFRSENAIYKACPTEECNNKKVVGLENGMYRCGKCNREYPNFKYRLLGFMNVGDWSGNLWISMFGSEAEKVLEMSAQAVGEAIEHNPEALADIADKTHFKQFVIKCRSKMETFNDENRLKTVAIKVDPINYKEYNSYLISKIQQLSN